MVRKIRLLIVDDHPLVRESIALFMAREPDIEVIASCENADSGAESARALAPDVVLMDIEMPGTDPFAVAHELRRSGASARFVFLSAYLTDTYVEAALALAPSGYLTKSAGIPDIADAVRSVHAGRNFFDDAVAARLSDGLPRGGTRSRLGRLTPREREVLRLVASDLSCKEIAQRLNLSVRTVDRHKANIMEKLAIHSQVGLTRFAVAEGVCDPRLEHKR